MRTSRIVRALAAALAVALVLACGGGGGGAGGGGGGGGNQGVTLNLYAASLAFGQTLNLTGSVPGVANQVLLWSATGGSIAPTGPSSATYTAPSVAGTYTITATSDADHNKRATVSVTVSSVGISIDPPAVTLGPNAQTTFTATVVGAANTAATFTCSGGTITQSGPSSATYRAPATVGSYTVTAKATANTTKVATATVTVANVGSNATVTGKVVVDGTQSGIQGITVAFYNVSGSEVARATTNVSGNFNATVPTTARRWPAPGGRRGWPERRAILGPPMLETGVDIVEIERIAELARRFGDRFGRRVFTPEESDVLIRPGPRMAEAARLMAACLERHAGGAAAKPTRGGAQ